MNLKILNLLALLVTCKSFVCCHAIWSTKNHSWQEKLHPADGQRFWWATLLGKWNSSTAAGSCVLFAPNVTMSRNLCWWDSYIGIIGVVYYIIPNWKTRWACSSCGFASGELAEGLPMHFMRPGGANLPLQIQNIPSFLADFALLIYVQDFGKGQFHMGFYFYHEYKHCTDMISSNFIWNRRSWRRQTGLDVGSEAD